MPTSPTLYKIAEAARLAGVSSSTLRLWEDQGIITPARTGSGQRQYSSSHIDLLRRIVRLREEQGLNPAAIRAMLKGGAKERPAKAETQSANDIGPKFRSLRRNARKTLDQVAKKVGIAASNLSTLERTSKGVSFKTLHDLAKYFGTTVSALSGQSTGARKTLVRAGTWRTWPQTMPGVTVQTLADGANQMDCHRFVLAPGASSEGEYRHDGEEFLHVLAGRLELILDQSEIYDLGPGDSLYFESKRRHSWANRHRGDTILLWINTPPTF